MKITIKDAIKNARNNTPTFLEVKSYRLKSHSKGDDNRNDTLIDEIHKNDLLSNFLDDKQKNDNEFDNFLKELLGDAINSKDLEDINIKTENILLNYDVKKITDFSTKRVNDQIYSALKNILKNENTIILGEDIRNKFRSNNKDYGGAFKVTKNLSDLYPERVMNMPISEGAIIGFSTGYAMSGKTSISEIMFGDFMTLTFDQIYQHASKFQTMFNDKNLDICLSIRTPMGGKEVMIQPTVNLLKNFFRD